MAYLLFYGRPVTVVSKNITPDATGKPGGLTLEEFKKVIRTGVDPSDNGILAVMAWPIYRNMTDRASTRFTPT
jgi:hypothetical protein